MDEHTTFATIDAAALKDRIEQQNAFVIDVRETSHGDMIYGSIRYVPKKLEQAERLVLPLPKGSGLIVLYDEDGKHERTTELANTLASDGYGEIRLLEGGFAAWKAADGRMQERSMEQPIPEVTGHQITR